MSFQLKSLKKTISDQSSTLFKKYVIVGDHLSAVSLYHRLLHKVNEQNVALIFSPSLSIKNLRPLGPNIFRDKNKQTDALFFKEMKFYEFGGRIKPQKLSSYEEFFLPPLSDGPVDQHFPCLNDLDFMTNLKQKCLNYIPSRISRSHNSSYIIKCTNAINIECQNLYWMIGPRQFFKHLFGRKTFFLDSIM